MFFLPHWLNTVLPVIVLHRFVMIRAVCPSATCRPCRLRQTWSEGDGERESERDREVEICAVLC